MVKLSSYQASPCRGGPVAIASFWRPGLCSCKFASSLLQGPFDVAVFNAVFGNLLDQHDALVRTCFLLKPGR